MGAGLEQHKRTSAHAGWMAAIPLAAVVTVVTSGCGSGGIATRGTTRQAGTSPDAASSTTTAVVKPSRSTLGILTNGKGRAVYLFEMDTGTKPSCCGACAAAWPPVLTTGHPVAGSAITAALLGTVRRTNGTLQVTDAGYPLYYFSADQKPGSDISGEGTHAFGGGWDLVSLAGKQVEKPGG